MHTASTSLSRIAGLVGLGAALSLPVFLSVAADAPTNADAFPSYESYIKVSGQTAWISGDDASYAARQSTPTWGSFGIEDFNFTKDLNDATTLTVNGHALSGTDDYLATLKIDETNVGSFDMGYKRFRTFYDGVGGFFPETDRLYRLTGEQLHVDRGTFWVGATYAKPDQPVFTFSYKDDVRTGSKDSTEWAPVVNPLVTVVKNALVGNALPANAVYINPNTQILDEHHRSVDAGVTAKIGRTTETFKFTYDWVDNVDSRNYIKYPNSLGVLADPTVDVTDDLESRTSNSLRLLDQTETTINDKLAVDVGLMYTHQNSTNGGTWLTPTYAAVPNAVYVAETAAAIYGTSTLNDYTGNVFLKYTPIKDLTADLGFRDESNGVGSSGGFMNTTLATGAKTVALTNINTNYELTYSHFLDHTETPELSLQYTGIQSLSLYGTFDDCIDRGTQHWVNPYIATTVTGAGVTTNTATPIGSVFFQDANQDYEDLKVGANWNASSMFTVRAEVYRKDHQNRFVGSDDIIGTGSYGGLFVTGYTFTGVKLSVIFKPLAQLSFNTRYQPQYGDMSVTAGIPNGGLGSEITSGKARGQMLSETINWTPVSQFYVQANVNVVYSYLQTAWPVVVVSAVTNIASPVNNADNNYVTGSALCGFVVDKQTDAQIQWAFQRADNYNPQVAQGGQPYGSSFEENNVTVGLKHKFSDRLIGEGRVGYLRWTDPTAGGFTNYNGPLAYVSLTYSL
jgi:hypothetical protein